MERADLSNREIYQAVAYKLLLIGLRKL
jgi:hypothetical protein